MRIRVISVVGGLLIAIVGWGIIYRTSSDTSHFATYADMRSSDFLQKGWVPAFVPHDAYDIVERHDLDSSEGVVEFCYRSESWFAQMKAQMHEATPDARDRFGKEAAQAGWRYRDSGTNQHFQSEDADTVHFVAINPTQKCAVYLRIAARGR